MVKKGLSQLQLHEMMAGTKYIEETTVGEMSTHLGDARPVKGFADQRQQATSCMQRETPMRKVQTPET